MTAIWHIVAIGHAPADFIADIDDDFLHTNALTKTACTPITFERANVMRSHPVTWHREPRGSAANTSACIAALGGKPSLITEIADDETGRFLAGSFEKGGIHLANPIRKQKDFRSDMVFALITPDRERSFATYYGVSKMMSPQTIEEAHIAAAAITLLEGYMLNTDCGHDILAKAAEHARHHNRIVAFMPNDEKLMRRYREHVQSLLQMTDVLILNESEARTLTEKSDLKDAIAALSGTVRRGAVTMGDNGAIVFEDAQQTHIPVTKKETSVVNTNGAGDNFAGGFLYGMACGMTLEKAAGLGHLCAAESLKHHSARPQKSLLPLLDDI